MLDHGYGEEYLRVGMFEKDDMQFVFRDLLGSLSTDIEDHSICSAIMAAAYVHSSEAHETRQWIANAAERIRDPLMDLAKAISESNQLRRLELQLKYPNHETTQHDNHGS